MNEEPQGTPPEGQSSIGTSAGAGESWQEVGQQFQALGQSLAQTVRTAWENEENQRRLQEMRTGLEAMVREVGQAIDDSMQTPQGQKIRAGAERTVETLRTAGEQTVQEVRPQLIQALQQLNNELQRLVNRMENKSSTEADARPPEQNDDASI